MSTTTVDDRITFHDPVVATAEFAADFPVFDDSDLVVIHDGVKRTDFTVSASYVDGISNDAKVIFSPGIIGEVLVVGARSPRRVSRFTNGAPIPTWQQNLVADILTAQAQERQRDIDRALKTPIGADPYSIAGGIVSGQLLVMGDDGVVFGGPEYEGIDNALADAQQAAEDAQQSEANAADLVVQASSFATAAGNSALDAQTAELGAQALVQAATAGFSGFDDGQTYDFGSVADSVTYFDQDWGSL